MLKTHSSSGNKESSENNKYKYWIGEKEENKVINESAEREIVDFDSPLEFQQGRNSAEHRLVAAGRCRRF